MEHINNVDYWSSVSSFIGNFLRRYPTFPSIMRTIMSIAHDVCLTRSDFAIQSNLLDFVLCRRPSMTELPRHVYDMLDTPVALRSYVIIACTSYLKDKEGLCAGNCKQNLIVFHRTHSRRDF